MLMKIEHGNLRAAPASRAFIPLPRGSSGYQPDPLGNLPSGRPRPANRRTRAPLGLGRVEYSLPLFSPIPGKSQTGKCAIARRGAASFCFLPLFKFFLPVKKRQPFGAGSAIKQKNENIHPDTRRNLARFFGEKDGIRFAANQNLFTVVFCRRFPP